MTVALVASQPLLAQVKYTPEHPKVKAMADRAAAALQIGGDVGLSSLTALAYVEYIKRYETRVPRDNEQVNAAIDLVLGSIGDDGPLLEYNECYQPALALILLAEVDSVKYKDEINKLLKMFSERQKDWGAFTYLNEPNSADNSQTQFVALAMWVAKAHDFPVDVEMGEQALDWLCKVQDNQGRWTYKYNRYTSMVGGSTLSMQAAGIGTAYLLADLLQLYKRSKDMSKASAAGEVGLPRTVNIYVPPVEGKVKQRSTGPLTNFPRSVLSNCVNAGNTDIEGRFRYGLGRWNYYYMYAVERYAFFREQAEGDVGSGALKDWYDQGIDFLLEEQDADGTFIGTFQETEPVATAFALLFMVRSSEVINLPPANSDLQGGLGFDTDATLTDAGNGRINSVGAEQDLSDLLAMLNDDKAITSDKLARITESMKSQIAEFRQKDNKSRLEMKAGLKQMVRAENYFRRLVAVRLLAAEQDMDNVPALIYALSDPDFRIAIEAHNGLRLVSRKIDTLTLAPETVENAGRDPFIIKENPELKRNMELDFKRVEKLWTDWFLKIRPEAEMIK